MSQQRRWRLSRRGFLIGAGLAGAGLALGVAAGLPPLRLRLAQRLEQGGGFGGLEAPPTAWFEITPDNLVRIFIPKIEMGQGVHTALAQIAAEELEADWEQVRVHQATTAQGPYDTGGTSGSTSVASLYTPLRQAAATMREMLRAEAARQLGAPLAELAVTLGAVQRQPGGQRLTFGQIVAGAGAWQVPKEAALLKARADFHTIGRPVPRVDFPAKLTGQAVYGYDARLPGMLYGAVARPPTVEARLRRAGPGQAARQPGVATVVAEDGFAGVAAESRAQAYAALTELDLEWEPGRSWQQPEIEELITVGRGTGVTIQSQGDAPGQLAQPTLVAEYRSPMAAHAHLEAQAALVSVEPERVRVWASTQFPDMVRKEVARVTGRPVEQVEVTPTYLGGGFGRKSGLEPAAEAARLSLAAGRPVHVGWTRTEDMRNGYVRPPTHHVLRARLEDGRIQAIEHAQASGEVAFGFLPGFIEAVMGADFGAWRGAMLPYTAPHVHTVAWRNDLPLRTGWWRGLGLLANTFATESFIDELAHKAGKDPVDFRVAMLDKTPRLKAAVQLVAQKSNWGEKLPARTARGISAQVAFGSFISTVVEVEVDNAGEVKLRRITSAVDTGIPVNPDTIVAQLQGGLVFGLSAALFNEITIKNGRVEQSNFHDYRMLRINEVPNIDVHLITNEEHPGGIGETGATAGPPALCNALFAATGIRLRKLPIDRDLLAGKKPA